MADVVVNITADASGLQNELNNVANGTNNRQTLPPRGSTQPTGTPLGGGTTVGGGQPSAAPQPTNTDLPSMPTYDRMAQDIRREIQNRGVVMVPGSSNFNQFMNMMTQQQRAQNEQAISRNFDVRYSQLDAQRYAEGAKIEADIDAKRQAALQNATTQDDIDRINANFDNVLRTRLERLDKKFAPQYDQLQAEEQNARQKAEEELTRVIQDLTEQIRQGNPDSYLNRLREERRQALWRRDNAATEEEVQSASRDVAAVDRRIARATGQQTPIQRISTGWGVAAAGIGVGMQAFDAYWRNRSAQISEVSNAANGNIFGAMLQDYERRRNNWTSIGSIGGAIAGGTIGAVSGGGVIGAAGGAALGSGIGNALFGWGFDLANARQKAQIEAGQLWSEQQQRLQQFTNLAMLIRRGRTDIDNMRGELLNTLPSVHRYSRSGVSIHDLGYTSEQAAQMMARNIQARGFIDTHPEAWALDVDALEKSYNMTPGSLAQLSSYDRYGNNATQDFANLIASLNNRRVIGMSGGQTLRSNEFLNYQMQLMQAQRNWSMGMSSEYATRQLLAAQDIYGNALDSRGIQMMSRVDQNITNPQEGYAKVMLYDVIQNEFENTRGNLGAIRKIQYSQDPEVRNRLIRAYYNRVKEVYGGANTTSGMLAFGELLGTQNPYEIERVASRLEKGLPAITEGNIAKDTQAVKEYTPQLTKDLLSIQDSIVKEISSRLGSLNNTTSEISKTFSAKLDQIIAELEKVNK